MELISFNKYSSHARHCARLWAFSCKQNRPGFALREQMFSGQRQAVSKEIHSPQSAMHRIEIDGWDGELLRSRWRVSCAIRRQRLPDTGQTLA